MTLRSAGPRYIKAMPSSNPMLGLGPIIPPAWQAEGTCLPGNGHNYNPDLWHSDPGTQKELRAIALCLKCPVLELCKDYGKNEKFGIWGGVNQTREFEIDGISYRRCPQDKHVIISDWRDDPNHRSIKYYVAGKPEAGFRCRGCFNAMEQARKKRRLTEKRAAA